MEFIISDNTAQSQFEIHEAGELAVLQYRMHEGVIWMMHTEVPKSLEGKGLASALAHHGFEWARERNIQVKVLCPFVAIYLKRHPEYNSIVVK